MTQIDAPAMEGNTKFKDGVNRNARLVVRNISFKATEQSLKEHFSQYGTVEEAKLLKKPDGRLVGSGFVHFTHVPMANKALAATNKKPFMGRPINVSWAVPKFQYDKQLQDSEQQKKQMHGGSYEESSTDKEDVPGGTKKKEDKNEVKINRNARLIVRNISFKATEETLKQHFEPYGELHEVKILKKPDGKLVGCAFVHYNNVPMAKNALLNTNMKPYLGRPISVDWAVAKDKYMQYVVHKQLEMQDDVKKEDSDSDDDDKPPINISNDDLKAEVKSESEDDNPDSDDDEKSEADDASGDEDDEDDEDDEVEDEEHEGNDDSEHDGADFRVEGQRLKLNDAEDGCTVFVTNIAFRVDNDQLNDFAAKTGPVKYALVCVDKLTEHSKGTGFIKFVNKEDADRFLSLPADQLRLEGQGLQVKPALKRENLQGGGKKEAKDNRNLYLVKEGVVVAGTKAAVGLSSSDMAKRLALERMKTQMLKNLNRFVSRYRLVVSNLPPHFDDAKLRKLCVEASSKGAKITEVRVMRDLRAPTELNGKHPSKGYGFVMFMKHEDALTCLRKLNNNPDVFDRNNRPIVSFSIEDRTALNARKKRLEKSIANNPLQNKHDQEPKKMDRKRRVSQIKPDESKAKKGKFDRNNTKNKDFKDNNRDAERPGKFVKPLEEFGEYTGLTAKQGTQHKMRTNHKLRTQADIHRQNVKLEKKQSKRTTKLKLAAKERIKQPKQKINKQKGMKLNEPKIKAAIKESSNFSNLVSKYKSKLAGNSLDRVKSKWYDN